MSKLIWKAEFQTGIDVLDADHMHLVRIYNDLVAIAEGGGGVSAGEALRDLFEHASLHFRREEAWLAVHACPQEALEQHRSEHRAQLDHLRLLIDGANADDDVRLSEETMTRLRDWLTEHTQGSDRECVLLAEKSLAEVEFEAMARLRKTPVGSSS